MHQKLATIATFDQPAKARLAQNILEAAGIQVSVSDESLVAMDWLLSNAVGGIKVQVWDEDVARAVEALERDGFGPEPSDRDIDELANEAEDEEGENEPDLEQSPESRDSISKRMAFAAILGLIIPPVAFYSLYLFLNAVFGEGMLSARGRLNLFLGGAMTLVGLVLIWVWLAVGMQF